LEFDAQQGRKFMHKMDPTDVDVLILAGDITVCKHLPYVVRTISDKYKDSQVLFVAGNHEHYGSSLEEVNYALTSLEKQHENFHWLNYNTFWWKGKAFSGGTLWFEKHATTDLYKEGLNDFYKIKNFESVVYEENEKAKNFFSEAMSSDVIITHHAPSEKSIKLSGANLIKSQFSRHFYVTDMTDMIIERGPKFWFHGHLHKPVDYVLGKTRVYSNPKGYPGREDLDYRGRYILELE